MEVASRNQSGISIVEALVAMVILLITLGGVYQIFQSNSLTYRMQEGLARVQENGRFAMDFLVNDIRMAGYAGCIGSIASITNTLNDDSSYYYDFSMAISGYNAQNSTWSPALPDAFDDIALVQGSDILKIRTLSGGSLPIAAKMPDTSASLKVAPLPAGTASPVQLNDIVLITDCIKAAVFQITQIVEPSGGGIKHREVNHNTGTAQSGPGNKTKDLGHQFEKGAEIIKIQNITYYIAYNVSNIPSLYKKEGSNSAVELIEGVEAMQILYGEDTSGDNNIDQYKAANAVGNWESIRGIRIGLLMRTPNAIRGMPPDSSKEYNVLPTDECPENGYDKSKCDMIFGPHNDSHLRRVFAATVGLRNKLK